MHGEGSQRTGKPVEEILGTGLVDRSQAIDDQASDQYGFNMLLPRAGATGKPEAAESACADHQPLPTGRFPWESVLIPEL